MELGEFAESCCLTVRPREMEPQMNADNGLKGTRKNLRSLKNVLFVRFRFCICVHLRFLKESLASALISSVAVVL
jgi:hypothetical protein